MVMSAIGGQRFSIDANNLDHHSIKGGFLLPFMKKI
jgi:hypothetical protein